VRSILTWIFDFFLSCGLYFFGLVTQDAKCKHQTSHQERQRKRIKIRLIQIDRYTHTYIYIYRQKHQAQSSVVVHPFMQYRSWLRFLTVSTASTISIIRSHCFVYDHYHPLISKAHFKYNHLLLNTHLSSLSSISGGSFSSSSSSAGSFVSELNNNMSKRSSVETISPVDVSDNTDEPYSSEKEKQDDSLLYNSYIAAAVEISQANVSPPQPQEGGRGTIMLSFLRLARDIDANTKRKYLYNVMLWNHPSITAITTSSSSSSSSSTTCTVLPPTQLPSNVIARIPSPSGDKVAIWIQNTCGAETGNGNASSKNVSKQIVEIWTQGGTTLSQQILLPTGTLHGNVCTDASWFGGAIQWNAQETALLYSAERMTPRTSSYFDQENGMKKCAKEDKQEDVIVGGGNVLGIGIGENWGEKYRRTSRLDLFVVHVETKRVGRVDNVPGRLSMTTTEGGYVLGQARFSPSGKHVVYTAWDAGEGGFMPKRLGSIYCYQRHCALYQSSVERLMERLSGDKVNWDGMDGLLDEDGKKQDVEDEECLCLTPMDRLARSPRFCHVEGEGTKLFWLSHNQGFDTHGGVMGLSSMEWDDVMGAKTDSRKDIVKPVYDVPEVDDDDDTGIKVFPGLFLNQLPEVCFTSKDGKYMFVTSQWRSTSKILRISTSTGEIQRISFDLNAQSGECNGNAATSASQSLLCITDQGDAIVTQSEPNSPPVIGFIPASSLLEENQHGRVPSSVLANLGPISATCNARLKTFATNDEKGSYSIIRVSPPHGNVPAPVEGILLLPSKSKTSRVPLIVVPHGGPHSCTPTSYIPSYAYLSQGGGYAILHVNFRGSTGFGQAALESLAGNAGTQDVLDCKYLTHHVLSRFNDSIDETRVGVCGGSHGGFLSAHLIGQYPDLFKVAAMRNPVTNIATMTTSTDIPDWCYIEALGIGSYDWTTFRGPTGEDLRVMWEASRKFLS
jgi:Dipeptidyl aminopeptidases/acylaminoacyl-peptidases